MTQDRQVIPETIRAWLNQQGAADVPLHHIGRALGIRRQEVETLLQSAPTAEVLLYLNRLAQYRHLALVDRVWPNCTWLEWSSRDQPSFPVIQLIRDTFGLSLLRYVRETFGEEVALKYWIDTEIPSRYADVVFDDDDDDPLADISTDQIVFNPHQEDEDDAQLFVFGSPETAACFRWLISSRYNYSHYVYNRTGYLNDPLGLRLAYDLRAVIKEEYWAPLPPDTLPAYLAIARALYEMEVPDAYEEGRLPPLHVVHAADIPANRLAIVQMDYEQLSLADEDILVFDQAPVRAFVLEPHVDRSPAALILTTHDEPGNPEQHRQSGSFRYLEDSWRTLVLTLMPEEQADLEAADEVIQEALDNTLYGFQESTSAFCISRANPYFGEAPDGLIPIYRIPGGYMLQFNPEYKFTPQEMAVE
ncbi:hypothetical protein ACFLYO_10540 [Chloroflexota bacterium]